MIELAYTGERAIPWEPATGARVMYHHVMRYAWALQWCAGKRVVDLGSGTGYGTYMLSWVAAEVQGKEIDGAALGYAIAHFRAPNLVFVLGDITERVPEADVYVAFEVLEHLDDPQLFVSDLNDVLLWSVPVHDDSQFHKHVYSATRAALDFGGDIYWQSAQGAILPEGDADFVPRYVLGVRE